MQKGDGGSLSIGRDVSSSGVRPTASVALVLSSSAHHVRFTHSCYRARACSPNVIVAPVAHPAGSGSTELNELARESISRSRRHVAGFGVDLQRDLSNTRSLVAMNRVVTSGTVVDPSRVRMMTCLLLPVPPF